MSVPISSSQQRGETGKPTSRVRKLEATGLLIIALLVLLLTIVRYWDVIPWRAR